MCNYFNCYRWTKHNWHILAIVTQLFFFTSSPKMSWTELIQLYHCDSVFFFTASPQMTWAQLIHLNHCDSAGFSLHHYRWTEQNWYIWTVVTRRFTRIINADEPSRTGTLNHCDSALYSLNHYRWTEHNWYIEPVWLSSLLTSSPQTNRGELIHWTIVTHLFFHFITTDELSSTDTIKPLWHRLFTDFITTDEMSRTDAFDELGLKCLLMLIEYIGCCMFGGCIYIYLLVNSASSISTHTNKGNNKITELRTILQRESPNS